MFDNINFSNIKIAQIELHNMCNLECPFCPRYLIMNKKIDGLVRIQLKILDFYLDEIIKHKNIDTLGLSGINQPILTKEDISLTNYIFEKVKSIRPDITIKLCTNGTTTKKLNYADIFDMNYDLQFFSRHTSDTFWVEDLMNELEKRNKKYTVYFNKKYEPEIIEFDNKKCIFKPDYLLLENVPLENLKDVIKKYNFPIVNVDNIAWFLEKETTSCKDICKQWILKMDSYGYLLPCNCSHSKYNVNLSYGKFYLENNEIKYEINKNRTFEICEHCQIGFYTDGNTNFGYDNNYIKIER